MSSERARLFIGSLVATLLILGIGFLFIGTIDLVHAMAYKGMNIFPSYGANLPTQLWIVARYTESLSLLMALLFFDRKIKTGLVVFCYLFIRN